MPSLKQTLPSIPRTMKALYFFPHAFYPTKTGAHVRAVQTLSSLNRIGVETHVVTLSDRTYPWSTSGRNAVGKFLATSNSQYAAPQKASVATDTRRLSKPHPNLDLIEKPEIKRAPLGELFHGDNNHRGKFLPDYFGEIESPMRTWIQETVTRRKIDVIFMPYPVYSGLVPRGPEIRRVMELYDMWTINAALQSSLENGFNRGQVPGKHSMIEDSAVLDLCYLPNLKVKASPFETHIVSMFPSAIAISRHDEKMLQTLGIPNVERIPVMVSVPSRSSPCLGRASLALGPNLLNTQGLAHFCHRILPQIIPVLPDFSCDLFGTVPMVERINLGPHIVNRGFVPDFGEAMCEAGFFINPVFSGTGMQIKTVETMAYGLPPVCYAAIAEDAGVRHLETGWVANDEKEFAEGVIALSKDESLRKRLGQAARDHVRNAMSESELDSTLGRFIAKVMALPPD
jgi:hypothetical protein